jgi:DNA-binding transcriptional MerR regulator
MAADKTEVTMMHIGELAEKSNMSLRTIRHYDEVDLLTPSGRSEGGFRLYTQDDLERLLLIRRMKPLGFTLEEMSDLLDIIAALKGGEPGSSSPDVRLGLEEFIQQVTVRRAKLENYLVRADELLTLLEDRGA